MTDTWKAARMDAALVAGRYLLVLGLGAAALAGLVLAAAVGLYALSVWVSVRIVTRKEL